MRCLDQVLVGVNQIIWLGWVPAKNNPAMARGLKQIQALHSMVKLLSDEILNETLGAHDMILDDVCLLLNGIGHMHQCLLKAPCLGGFKT